MIDRRGLLLAATSFAACSRSGEATTAQLGTFLGELPRDVVGAVPFEPYALQGRVVLITFIATWCFPCLTELRTLSRLQELYGAKGFSNVLVGMDLEGRAVLEPFVAGYQLDYPLVVADERIRSGDTVFGRIRELPSRVLFARSGELVVGYTGNSKYEDLERVVASEVSKH